MSAYQLSVIDRGRLVHQRVVHDVIDAVQWVDVRWPGSWRWTAGTNPKVLEGRQQFPGRLMATIEQEADAPPNSLANQ